MPVRVQTGDFDAGAEIAAHAQGRSAMGGVASFIGVVRDLNEGDQVAEMTLEHYPGHDREGPGENRRGGEVAAGKSTTRWWSTGSGRSGPLTRSCWWW